MNMRFPSIAEDKKAFSSFCVDGVSWRLNTTEQKFHSIIDSDDGYLNDIGV